MISARKFVLHYAPFTSAGSVRRGLALHAPEDWDLRLHAINPESRLNHEEDDREHWVTVRNPYAWYVCWYCRQRQGVRRDGLFDQLSKNGTLDFLSTMKRVFEWETIRKTGIGLFTMAMHQALGRHRNDARPIRAEHLHAELLDALRSVEDVPESVERALIEMPDQDLETYRHWQQFYDDATRDLVAKHDSDALAVLGYSWEEAQADHMAPGIIRPTQGVSIPRSGHSALFNCVFHYFREEITFCDLENPAHCGCNHAPCIDPRTNLAKNHDFALLRGEPGLPVDPTQRFLIQYRNPVRCIVSNYKLHLRSTGAEDTEAEWQEFIPRQIGYWNTFMDKWVFGTEHMRDRALLCSYHDLVNDTPTTLTRVVEFMTGAPADEHLVDVVLRQVNISARDSIREFRYFDENVFRRIESDTAERMARAGVPAYEESP